MPSIGARQFTQTFRTAFAKSGRIDQGTVRKLEQAASRLTDPGERAQAKRVLSMVEHDRELDAFEVAPAKKALATLLGVTAERLPAEVAKALTHAVPAANVTARHYDLSFDFSHDGPSFPGVARIDLDKPAGAKARLEIDPERLTVGQVLVDGKPVPFAVEQSRLVVTAPGASSIEVRYQVKPDADMNGYGLIRERHSGAMWTMLWPDHTGALFPSNSHPADGATATVTVKVANGQQVVGPGKPEDGRFELKHQVPAYAIAIYAGAMGGRAEAKSRSGIEVESIDLTGHVAPRIRKAYTDAAAEALDFYGKWLGDFDFGKKLNFVEVDGDYGGIENAAAITVMANSLQSVGDARAVAVHETAHHWFGDNLRLADWGQFWMSEGFTTYAEFRYFRHKQGESEFLNLLDTAKDDVAHALGKNADGLAATPTTDVRAIFGDLPYEMGAWMLRMLEAKIGTAPFDGLLRDWFQAHRGGAVSNADFVAFLKQKTGVDYTAFFKAWNNLTALPTFKDQSRIEGTTLQVSMQARTTIPAGLELPVELLGKHGERALRWVDPSKPGPVDAGFPIAEFHWDPERMVLATVK